MKYPLIAIVCFLISCNNPCKNCDCDNVDDCLSKYKFEEARKYASTYSDDGFKHDGLDGKFEYSKPDAIYKIIIAETQYWISQNELNKAIEVSKELLSISIKDNNINSDEINEFNKNKSLSYCDLNYSIIRKYCVKQNYEDAKIAAMQLPEKCIYTEIVHISWDHVGLNESRVDVCHRIYNKYKKELKPNQEIEPFKESEYDDYNITTSILLRKEALKIIEEYKNIK